MNLRSILLLTFQVSTAFVGSSVIFGLLMGLPMWLFALAFLAGGTALVSGIALWYKELGTMASRAISHAYPYAQAAVAKAKANKALTLFWVVFTVFLATLAHAVLVPSVAAFKGATAWGFLSAAAWLYATQGMTGVKSHLREGWFLASVALMMFAFAEKRNGDAVLWLLSALAAAITIAGRWQSVRNGTNTMISGMTAFLGKLITGGYGPLAATATIMVTSWTLAFYMYTHGGSLRIFLSTLGVGVIATGAFFYFLGKPVVREYHRREAPARRALRNGMRRVQRTLPKIF